MGEVLSDQDARPLTAKQQCFVEEYLVDLNATQAAIRAGYAPTWAGRNADRLTKKDEIAAAIAKAQAERSERTHIKADRVVEELARVAFSDIRDVVSFGAGGVALKESDDLSLDVAAAIESVGHTDTKDGCTVRVKLHNKLEALNSLAKHLGMFEHVQAHVVYHDVPAASVAPVVVDAEGRRLLGELAKRVVPTFQTGQEGHA